MYLKHLLRGVKLGLFDETAAMQKFTTWSSEHEEHIQRRQQKAIDERKAKRRVASAFPRKVAEPKVEETPASEASAEGSEA